MHARDEDREGNAEGHAADDEHGVHPARHAGGGEAIEHIARGVDGRETRHEENGARDERVPHGAESEHHRDHPCAERGDEACNHGAGVWIERVARARTVCDKSCERGDGGNECLEPAAAEELA